VEMQLVGAGLGRTGTLSLKQALEHLLGAPCYHMMETFGRPDDIPVWHRAVNGEMPEWRAFLADYAAAVDWPVAAFWRELSDAFPDAVVLLSTRPTDAWWTSASSTIFRISERAIDPGEGVASAQISMARDMLTKRFTANWHDETEAKMAYEAHNAAVRAAIPPDRLVEWHPGDGWAPICDALGVAVPGDPFPHVNTTADFLAMTGLDS
jgi:hypothetical protein